MKNILTSLISPVVGGIVYFLIEYLVFKEPLNDALVSTSIFAIIMIPVIFLALKYDKKRKKKKEVENN